MKKNLPSAPQKKPAIRRRQTFGLRPPPRNVRPNRLEDLPPKQAAALKQWLFKDELTYRQVLARLLSEFGVKISMSRLCKYWMSHRPPVRTKQPPAVDNSNIPFDVVIQSTRAVRIRIFHNQGRLHTQIVKSIA